METYGQINPSAAITRENVPPFRFRTGGVVNLKSRYGSIREEMKPLSLL